MIKIIKLIMENTMIIIAVLVLAWFVMSWAEIISKNTKGKPVYSNYNAIVIMIDAYNNK